MDNTSIYCKLPACVHSVPWNDSHVFQKQQAESNGVDAVLPEPSPDDQLQQENNSTQDHWPYGLSSCGGDLLAVKKLNSCGALDIPTEKTSIIS